MTRGKQDEKSAARIARSKPGVGAPFLMERQGELISYSPEKPTRLSELRNEIEQKPTRRTTEIPDTSRAEVGMEEAGEVAEGIAKI